MLIQAGGNFQKWFDYEYECLKGTVENNLNEKRNNSRVKIDRLINIEKIATDQIRKASSNNKQFNK